MDNLFIASKNIGAIIRDNKLNQSISSINDSISNLLKDKYNHLQIDLEESKKEINNYEDENLLLLTAYSLIQAGLIDKNQEVLNEGFNLIKYFDGSYKRKF